MTTYGAFLRGVNLGPTRKVAMSRLRELATGLGYDDVATLQSSGNLILTTDRSARQVERELSTALADEYGVRVDVAVRSADELRALLAANPYPEGSPSQVTVAFLTGPPSAGAAEKLRATATANEPFTIAAREVWVHYGDGQARSKLAARFSDVVGVSATVRTVGTLGRVVAKLDG